MKLAVHSFIIFVDQFESVASITIHVSVTIRCPTVWKQKWHLMGCLWSQRDEIPEHVRILVSGMLKCKAYVLLCILLKSLVSFFGLFSSNHEVQLRYGFSAWFLWQLCLTLQRYGTLELGWFLALSFWQYLLKYEEKFSAKWKCYFFMSSWKCTEKIIYWKCFWPTHG